MKREVTRKQYALPKSEALKIIKKADYGILSTVNSLGNPCAVALNHVMVNNETLIFHSALKGEKIENIRINPNVTFFVVSQAKVIAERFTTTYKSAVAHGIAEIIEDDNDEKRKYLNEIITRFVGGKVPFEKQNDYIKKELPNVLVIKMTIQHLTGKACP